MTWESIVVRMLTTLALLLGLGVFGYTAGYIVGSAVEHPSVQPNKVTRYFNHHCKKVRYAKDKYCKSRVNLPSTTTQGNKS